MFRDDSIKPYVPGVWLDFLDSLAFKREPEQFWPQPAPLVIQESKTTIKIATTHSDSVSEVIKSDNRRDHEVDLSRRNSQTCDRLPKAILVFLKFGLRGQLNEVHAEVLFDDGGEDAFLHTPGAFDDATEINLVLRWQVARDRIAGCKLVHTYDALGNDSGKCQAAWCIE